MSKKFTYLLGAGASAKKIPTVASFANELVTLSDNLKSYSSRAGHTKSESILEEISDGFKWLSNNSIKFGTVDTYAKILFLSSDKNYKKLKDLLTIFFLIRQKSDTSTNKWFSKGVDPRYFNFLASVLDKQQFPENLKILTWNYDFQLEIAASELVPNHSLVQRPNGNIWHRKPFIIEHHPTSDLRRHRPKNYHLIHLNGIAGLDLYNEEPISYLHKGDYTIEQLCEIFDGFKSTDATFIKFSWDDDSGLELIKDHLEETETLVVIGYSFPFFNRVVDTDIFKLLKNLKTIYYQDTNPKINGQNLYDQFNLSKPINSSEVQESEKDVYNLIKLNKMQAPGVKINMIRDEEKFFVPYNF